jgi:hypothetical protein
MRPPRIWNGLWPLLLVAISAVVVRWLFLAGPAGSDDTRYINAALALARGDPPGPPDFAQTRAGFIAWLALWCRLGLPASQMGLSQVAASALQAAALFWVGTKLIDRVSAAIGTLAWIFYPVELTYGGFLSPDQLGLALALSALAFFLSSLGNGEVRSTLWSAFAAGVFTGLAYSVKEPYLLLLGLFALWSLYRLGFDRGLMLRGFAIGLGFLVLTILEVAFFASWTGDGLYRYRVTTGGLNAAPVAGITFGSFLYYLRDVVASFAVSGMYGWMLAIGLIASLDEVKENRLILLWTAVFFVFLQFASTSTQEYRPLPMQPRYVGPIVVLLFFPLGRTLVRLAGTSPLRGPGTIVLATAVLIHGIGITRGRLAEGVYLFDVVSSAIEVQYDSRLRGLVAMRSVLVPHGFLVRLPLDLKPADFPWEELPEKALGGDLAARVTPTCRCVLVMPRVWSEEAVPRLARSELQSTEIRRPITHADRLLASAPRSWGWLGERLNRAAVERVVGRLYYSTGP